MDMLLRHISMRDLADMYDRHADCSPVPYLRDPASPSRIRRLARQNGLWDQLDALDPTAGIAAFRGSQFRQLRRFKDRRDAGFYQHRSGPFSETILATWLNHPNGDVDFLQDLAWAYCEDTTWVHGVHDHCDLDLNAASKGADLAELVHVFGDRLDGAVRERIAKEVQQRLFGAFWNWRKPEWWKTDGSNWNHVCNGSVIRAALYLVDDPEVLAHLTHGAIQGLTYALDAFADDGGCTEGPGYWRYGFGHYLRAAHALHQRTGGELDIMAGDKLERICRYPLAAHISGPAYAPFADASPQWMPAWIPLLINRFVRAPELYELCRLHPHRGLCLSDLLDLALYDGERAGGVPCAADYELPELGQVKLRGGPGRRQLTVAALAGHNGVPHNHNDVGSFVVARGERLLLTDPGAPMYTEQTFSPRRYEIIHCRSRGHSVPVIGGREQLVGANHRGTLETHNLNGTGVRRAVIDMTRAYPRGSVRRLVRTLELDGETNRLELCDEYAFASPPQALEEAFVTFEQATVAGGGAQVQVGPKNGGLALRAVDTPGSFAVEVLEEETRPHARTEKAIVRITFTPSHLCERMCLRFAID